MSNNRGCRPNKPSSAKALEALGGAGMMSHPVNPGMSTYYSAGLWIQLWTKYILLVSMVVPYICTLCMLCCVMTTTLL